MTEHGAHAPSPLLALFLAVVNFTLFVGLLIYYLRGPIKEYFRERTARLREALAAGARARREAEELRATLARDVADLPALRESLRADALATAASERAKMIAAGARAAERIREDARLLAEHELAAARHALRREVIDEAVREAVAIVRKVIRPEDQERLVREFVSSAGAVQ
jgi:F-type H+-transporting ATPase subunit b